MTTGAAMSRVKCQTKGCINLAVDDDIYCANHQFSASKGLSSLPQPPEFEIVKLSTVPLFKVVNERAFNIAKAILALQPDNALKVRGREQGKKISSSVSQMCTKLGVKIKYRTMPDAIYFWKVNDKKE